ncbi:hypothetical protein [Embleya sp. NBC_00896]|uniref:hypothetical protein n=1 Tax=Embleya sp. NBC_00896 TaxID=2975961 RepID=UPI002F907936|nr:hypothetical protein OG928_38890 [Embleya sp. NBC_00896]
MRCARLAVVGTIVGVTVFGSAGAAFAAAPMVAESGRPGDTVLLSDDKHCTANTATASSDAFAATVTLTREGDEVKGSAIIGEGVATGDYAVTVTCGEGQELVGSLHVMGDTPSTASTAGLGGTQGADVALLAAGSVLLVGAVGTGVVAIRRRASNNA